MEMPERFIVVLPFRTLLANEYNNMLPMKRGWYSRMLWAEMSNRIPWKVRPKVPWEQWSILIERESTKEPDPGAIWAGCKPIPDILQPKSAIHPYGLGIVREDNSDSLIAHACKHVNGKVKRTTLTIIHEG